MRERILAVAGRLFAERGFGDTSVQDIASELGISNLFHYHFPSKADLLDELLREPLARVQQAVQCAEKQEGRDRLPVIIDGMLEALEVHDGVAEVTHSDRIATTQELDPMTTGKHTTPLPARLDTHGLSLRNDS